MEGVVSTDSPEITHYEEKLIDSVSVGTWLYNQREVRIGEIQEALKQEGCPKEALLGELFKLTLLQLSDEKAQEMKAKVGSALLAKMEELSRKESDPRVGTLFDIFAQVVSSMENHIDLPKLRSADESAFLMKAAQQTPDLNVRSALLQELFVRQCAQLTPEQKNNISQYKTAVTTWVLLGNTQRALTNQKIYQGIQAVMNGKECPDITIPMLDMYHLEKKCGVKLNGELFLKEMEGIKRELSALLPTVACPHLGLDTETAEKFAEGLTEMIKKIDDKLRPYEGIIGEFRITKEALFGSLIFYALYCSGHLFEGDCFQWVSHHFFPIKTPQQSLDAVMNFYKTAVIIGRKNRIDGERFLKLVNKQYVAEIQPGWFGGRDWDVARVCSLLLIGRVAHTLGLACEKEFTDEAESFLKKLPEKLRTQCMDSFGYNKAKKTWFNNLPFRG